MYDCNEKLAACCGVIVLLLMAGRASAIGPEPVPLWPDGAPGAVGNEDQDRPDLRIYLPEKAVATGAGVVICPGGAYAVLAMDHEGHQVARWLNSQGVAGFVLKYRLGPRYRHPAVGRRPTCHSLCTGQRRENAGRA